MEIIGCVDKVYIDGKLEMVTNEAGAAVKFAKAEAAKSGVECIVSLDNGAYGYRIGFLYEDDLREALS